MAMGRQRNTLRQNKRGEIIGGLGLRTNLLYGVRAVCLAARKSPKKHVFVQGKEVRSSGEGILNRLLLSGVEISSFEKRYKQGISLFWQFDSGEDIGLHRCVCSRFPWGIKKYYWAGCRLLGRMPRC